LAKILLRHEVRNLDENRINEEIKDSYYMDDALVSNLDIVKGAVTYDWDFLIVIDGIERGGNALSS
jgi:hypothetical protein